MSRQETSQKPDDEDDLHRLRDIVVEEVSLVDRAANKRRFLVVKRSGDMPEDENLGAEVVPDDNGGLNASAERVEKAKRKPKVAPEADEAEKARGRATPADEEDTEKTRRRTSTDDDEEETAEAEKAAARKKPGDEDDEEDEEEATEKARSRRGSTVGDEPDANEELATGVAEKADVAGLSLPKPLKDAMLRALTGALERLMAIANQVKESSEPDDGDKETGLPEKIEEELDAIAELIENSTKADENKRGAKKKSIAKAGARMAKDRLDRFQKALTLLSEVLKELTDAKAAAAPTAGSAESGVRKHDAAAVPGLGELVAGIDELTRVVKRQEEELGRIRKTRGVSNAIPVDGSRRPEPQEVAWPLDMNRPISRDSVAKAVSFYDE